MNPITGPSFTACLPFEWQANGTNAEPNDWEVLRYLMVLAEMEQGAAAVELAQARQDLLLLWLAKNQTIKLPATQTISVGLNQVSWISQEALGIGEAGLVRLCFSMQFPLLLTFKAEIEATACFESGQWQNTARLIELDPLVLDQFEQTVFRYHRRAIQQLKQVGA